jgi:hypothetical protein
VGIIRNSHSHGNCTNCINSRNRNEQLQTHKRNRLRRTHNSQNSELTLQSSQADTELTLSRHSQTLRLSSRSPARHSYRTRSGHGVPRTPGKTVLSRTCCQPGTRQLALTGEPTAHSRTSTADSTHAHTRTTLRTDNVTSKPTAALLLGLNSAEH